MKETKDDSVRWRWSYNVRHSHENDIKYWLITLKMSPGLNSRGQA